MDKLTKKLAGYFQRASELALLKENPQVEPLHVLAAIAEETGSIVANAAGAKLDKLAQGLGALIDGLPRMKSGHDGNIHPAKEFSRIFNLAYKRSAEMGDSHVSSDVYVQTCSREYQPAKKLLAELDISEQQIDEAVAKARAGENVTSAGAEQSRGALERFTTDLTESAREGKLDPVIGRDDEIRRTMQILQRRRKNNPVIIGDPGVGKTAIVEGLAQRIVAGEVPEGLKGRRLLVLDIASILAGASHVGDFEERLQGVLKEIARHKDEYVIFIDELHTLVGAGAGSVDAANMLKPALARGELRCIGATTLDEYRQYIEKDAAFERRFQRLLVQEPDETSSVSILRGLADRYMVHHGVRITDSAMVAAVRLSSRYISDRFLPDKAIDLVDEAAAKLRIERDSKPDEIDRLDRQLSQLKIDEAAIRSDDTPVSKRRLGEVEKKIKDVEQQIADLSEVWRHEKALHQAIQENKEQIEQAHVRIESLKQEGKYEDAAKLQYVELEKLEGEMRELEKRTETQLLPLEVGETEIAEIVARATGIPVTRLLGAERERLLGIKDSLKQRVVDQDEAVDLVGDAVLRSRAGLSDPNQPNGSFLFLGPTGVGKTELAKALAEFLFDSEKHLVRIDMSEYMERHAVARLIGAPPGYVGYEEGGQLTEAVRRRPYSVVLFDEIEKAHPEVLTLLLQVLDDGRLTDSQGRTVDFRNTVLVMTSNLGSEALVDGATENARSEVMAEVRRHLRPEFINRLDELIVFNSLDGEAIQHIAGLQLELLASRLKQEHIFLEYDGKAVKLLAREGFDPVYGARPLQRAMQHRIETPLASHVLDGSCHAGTRVKVSAKDAEFIFAFSSQK